MNLLDDQNIIDELAQSVIQRWGLKFEHEAERKITKQSQELGLVEPELSHDKIKDMVFEIGKIHHYMTDKEYEINSDRLDVVWRRVEKSVPTYAFEIQIGGDLYHALAKLKHAYDLWNSQIYIVTEDRHRDKIEELLAGTFHEIKNVLKVINLKQIDDLYSLQVKDVKLRKQIGLP